MGVDYNNKPLLLNTNCTGAPQNVHWQHMQMMDRFEMGLCGQMLLWSYCCGMITS